VRTPMRFTCFSIKPPAFKTVWARRGELCVEASPGEVVFF